MSEETPATGETTATTDTTPDGAGAVTDLAAELDKWKSLARKHEQQAKANSAAAKKLAELEDANKSELEKLTDQLRSTQTDLAGHAAAALRLEVALEKAPEGMPPAKIRTLAKRLTGSTREELEADADELFAEFTPKPAASSDGGEKKVRPTPALRRTVPVDVDVKQDTAAVMNDWLRAKAAGR